MPLKTELLWKPGICVMVAGFQNIDEDDPPGGDAGERRSLPPGALLANG